jgi:hypothetical protein
MMVPLGSNRSYIDAGVEDKSVQQAAQRTRRGAKQECPWVLSYDVKWIGIDQGFVDVHACWFVYFTWSELKLSRTPLALYSAQHGLLAYYTLYVHCTPRVQAP